MGIPVAWFSNSTGRGSVHLTGCLDGIWVHTATRALGIAGLATCLACTDSNSPKAPRVSISGPSTVMVGDAIQLTVIVERAVDAFLYWEPIYPFRVAQLLGSSQVYGVGAGSAQIKVSLQSDSTFATLAADSIVVTVVPPPASNRPAFSQIAAGDLYACALSSDGSTFCWGLTSGYRVFAPRCEDYPFHRGYLVCHSIPVRLQEFPRFKFISLGTYSTCAITLGDDAFCWGIGPYNYGNTSGNASTVPGGIKFTKVSVETGYGLNYGGEIEHVCGIATSGQLYCWTRGGSPTNPSVISGTDYADISVGGISNPTSDRYRACAVDIAGVAYCWGTLPLGDGRPIPSSEQTTPIPVGGGLRFTRIATGSAVTCGLSTDGEAYCWGKMILAPTAVPTSLRFATISAGATTFCAIAADQGAYCWSDGELQSEPTRVPGSYHFRAISVGGPVGCGLTVEGPEVCWGGQGMGNVGDGVVANATVATPTPVAGQRILP
jgi:alpha-tubulin suppressor-like RCC1 family protein